MEELTLRCAATDAAVTAYWDKPRAAAAGQTYIVFLNGKEAARTEKTHATLPLPADTQAVVSVVCETEKGTLTASVTAHTRKTPRRIDVTKPPYEAKGDGEAMNTAALQRALDNCGKGECVYFPKGIYRTGALRGHGDMEIYLDEGAVLQGTEMPEDYLPRIPSRFEGYEMECYSSLLNFGKLDHASGPNCENVLIHGKGTIASGGQTLGLNVIESERKRLREELARLGEGIRDYDNENTIPGRVRPRLINLSNCKNVRISGLTLQDGACWNVHMIYCDGIVTDHCTFRSEGVWNGDGWDPDSSENCTLFASRFFTGDDGVAIKSGKNPEGNAIGRASRHIRVFDCESVVGHGIVIGSEMSGGVEDVKIWDCDLRSSMWGLEIKATRKRGGYVRGVEVRDCAVSRVSMHAVGYNDDGVPAPEPPKLGGCLFERVALTGMYQATHDGGDMRPCAAIELRGFDTPGYEVRDVVFRDVTVANASQGIFTAFCEGVTFENLRCCEKV